MKIEIKNRWTNETIMEVDGETLHGTDFFGANLRNANLCWTDLHGANLHETDLCNADLHDADLHGADLRDANLCGTKIKITQSADFLKAIGIMVEDVTAERK